MFAVFYVKKKWDKHAKLKKADPQEYNKLITWYKAVLNNKTNATGMTKNYKPIEFMVELLKMILI